MLNNKFLQQQAMSPMMMQLLQAMSGGGMQQAQQMQQQNAMNKFNNWNGGAGGRIQSGLMRFLGDRGNQNQMPGGNFARNKPPMRGPAQEVPMGGGRWDTGTGMGFGRRPFRNADDDTFNVGVGPSPGIMAPGGGGFRGPGGKFPMPGGMQPGGKGSKSPTSSNNRYKPGGSKYKFPGLPSGGRGPVYY